MTEVERRRWAIYAAIGAAMKVDLPIEARIRLVRALETLL